MNRIGFLRTLHEGLAGLPERDIDEILADYNSHFEEGLASGRSEAEVAAALGDPRRLARELRAETGLRRWENHHSFGNSAAVLLAFGGLAAVDGVCAGAGAILAMAADLRLATPEAKTAFLFTRVGLAGADPAAGHPSAHATAERYERADALELMERGG